MRIYKKPLINVNELKFGEAVASLNTWLSANGLEEAGITTYIVNS